jgi:hemerythrin-like domain-containing protein
MAAIAAAAHAVWAFAEHEHRDLARGINRIHEVACEVGRLPVTELSARLDGVLQWLEGTLEPHIAWEESWLFPEIDAQTGTPWATRAARFDHRQLREMAARLHADQLLLRGHEAGDQRAEVRCNLFSFEALVRAHIEREERFLIPLLNDDGSGIQADGGVAPVAASR